MSIEVNITQNHSINQFCVHLICYHLTLFHPVERDFFFQCHTFAYYFVSYSNSTNHATPSLASRIR